MLFNLRRNDLMPLVKKAVGSWLADYAPSMGAALSYYTMFSIAPLLIIIIAVVGLVFGREAASGQIMEQLGGLIGVEGAAAVQGLIKSASSPGKSIFATIAGVATLVVGATTVFGELQSDLDRIWQAPEKDKPAGLWGMLRTRFLSFGLVLGMGFVLLVSLVVSAGVSALGHWWAPLFAGWEIMLQLVNLVLGFVIVTVLFAMIYKLLPSVKIAWYDVWIGAAVTSVLFSVGKLLTGLYIGKSGVVSGFGAAASIVVLLIWVYYSAQIFLLGAEFTYVYAHDFGSLRGRSPGRNPSAANATIADRDAPAHTHPTTHSAGTRALAPAGVSDAAASPASAARGFAGSSTKRLDHAPGVAARERWVIFGIAAAAGFLLGELSNYAPRAWPRLRRASRRA